MQKRNVNKSIQSYCKTGNIRRQQFIYITWGKSFPTLKTARKQKKIGSQATNPEYSLEGLMLKLKLQSFGHLMKSRLTGKDPDAGNDRRQKEKTVAENEMIG